MCVLACSIACENGYCHSALGGGAAPSPFFWFKSHLHYTSVHVYIYIYVFLHVALPVKTGIVILLWGDALRLCFCFDSIPMRVHA